MSLLSLVRVDSFCGQIRLGCDVGYESVSQFNREYSRFFGLPPLRDVRTLLASDNAASGLLTRRNATLGSLWSIDPEAGFLLSQSRREPKFSQKRFSATSTKSKHRRLDFSGTSVN
jgi:AraC-like DNA-binding protein